jgi:hypothetical protein
MLIRAGLSQVGDTRRKGEAVAECDRHEPNNSECCWLSAISFSIVIEPAILPVHF